MVSVGYNSSVRLGTKKLLSHQLAINNNNNNNTNNNNNNNNNNNIKTYKPQISIFIIHSKYFQVSDWLKPHA